MASISNDPNGRKRILFLLPDGQRKAIRLGKCDIKTAMAIKVKLESLLAAKLTGTPIPQDVATWLGSISDELHDKLAKVGLVGPRQKVSVGEWVKKWLETKRSQGYKPGSLGAWVQVVNELDRLFGKMTLLAVDGTLGERYYQALCSRGLRPTTIQKRIEHARSIFNAAIRAGLVARNPFSDIRIRGCNPDERRFYVSVDIVKRVIEAAPNVYWRLLIALGRFGGLRIPSEALSLRWTDILWDQNRMVVPSPKTENVGKPYRVIPLFPLLRQHLEEAWNVAKEGDEFIFPEDWRRRAMRPDGWKSCNLRTTFEKIVRRSGVEPWPRLWHNLRASCESDLAQSFPIAVVTKWLGNTVAVAMRHYVDATDKMFELGAQWVPAAHESKDNGFENRFESTGAAVKGGAKSGAPTAQKAAQQGETPTRTNAHEKTQPFFGCVFTTDVAGSCALVQKPQADGEGFEPPVPERVQQFSRLPP